MGPESHSMFASCKGSRWRGKELTENLSMLYCGLKMMEFQSKERFRRQSRSLSVPFKSLQTSSLLVLCKRQAVLIRIWLLGLCVEHRPNSGWAKQTDGMLQLCEQSKGLQPLGGWRSSQCSQALSGSPRLGLASYWGAPLHI